MNPLPVRENQDREPKGRWTRVIVDINSAIEQIFDYYPPYSSGVNDRLTTYSVWAYPWWLAIDQSDRIHGAFSSAFSSAFSQPEFS